MSQTNTTFDEFWSRLLPVFNGVFELKPMTDDEFMRQFKVVYNYFNGMKYSQEFLDAHQKQSKSEQKGSNQNGIVTPGSQLYFNVKQFLKNYLENIAANGNNLAIDDFLRFYAKTWEKYQFFSKIVDGILLSFNQSWVHRQRTDGFKDVFNILTVAMKIWQDVFFKESNQSLIQRCILLINEERNGGRIDSTLISQVVKSYVHAGFAKSDKNDINNQTIDEALVTYREYFEKPFLAGTEQFYRLESNEFFANNSVNDYIKKVYQRFAEEETRVKNVLHQTSMEKLQRLLTKVLIQDHLESMYVEAKKLLRDDKREDLRKLYELINRVANAHEPIQKDLEAYTYQVGFDEIHAKKDKASKEPKVYIETILEVYEKFSKIVTESFCNNAGYKVALDKAFSKFVNDNAVTREAARSTKSPELLAKYCDMLLRKGTKAEATDVEEKINQIMVVFNYVEDKDVFQKFYGKLLAKRLVGQLSASDDYEESMISKLKAACGFEYASKLQRMFEDIRLSSSLIEDYRTHCTNSQVTDIVDFSVMVLTSNSWPFSAPAFFNLPNELRRTFESFTNFYATRFSGRKLQWLHQHSKGDVQTLYTKPKYTLHVSTYQMAVLLLFNQNDRLTVDEILGQTQIENDSFRQVIISLLKSKVLICQQIPADQLDKDLKDNDIKHDYTIEVDTNFTSKKIKINLNQPIKAVEQKDSDTVNQSVEEDRKILIQAAIVRVMKARKYLIYNELIEQVIPQLTSRFIPKIPMIKKCVEILIEKDFLERKEQIHLYYLP